MQLECIFIILQVFKLDRRKGSCFDLRDGVGCQVQSLQGNIWLELMIEQIGDSIVDSK